MRFVLVPVMFLFAMAPVSASAGVGAAVAGHTKYVRVFPKEFKHKNNGRCLDDKKHWIRGCK